MSDTQQTTETEEPELDVSQIIADAESVIPASEPDGDPATDATPDPEPEPLDFTDQFGYSLPETKPESEPVSSEQKEVKTEAEKLGVDTSFKGGVMPQQNVPQYQPQQQQVPQVFAPISQEFREDNPAAAQAMDAQQQQVVQIMQFMGQKIESLESQLGNTPNVLKSVFEEREHERVQAEKAEQERVLYQKRVEARDSGMKEFQDDFNATSNELIRNGFSKEDINAVLGDAAEIYTKFTPASPPITSYKGYKPDKVAVDPYLGQAMSDAVTLARFKRGLFKPDEIMKYLPKMLETLKRPSGVTSSSARQSPTMPGNSLSNNNDAEDVYSEIDRQDRG